MAKDVRVAILGDASNFSRAIDKVQRDTRRANDSFGGVVDGANRMGSKFGAVMGRMAKAGAITLGVGLVGGLVAAGKSVANFQTSLNTLGAVSGASTQQLKKVQDLAIELGNDLTLPGTSASDAADAMVELAKGGLTVAESMDAAKGVLQLSAAAQIENAEAATITANALNAFGLEAKEAMRVSDLLAAAANASSAEITDVALAMQQAGAVFASAHVPIEDLTAAIGLLANAGIKGSDAGTSLKTMLTRVLAPASKKARDAIKDLGVKVFDAKGNFIGMRATIKQFSAGLKGLSQEQKVAALNTIFGSDAIRAANILLDDGVGKWDDMSKAVNKQGAAADVAGAKMKGLGGAIEGFKSVLETLALQLGLKIGPPLEKLARWLSEVLPGAFETAMTWVERFVTDTLESLSKWWDENGANIQEAAKGFGDTLSGVFIWLQGVYEGYLKPMFDSVTDWLTDSPGRLQAVAAVIGGALVTAFLAWAASAALAAGATALAIAPLLTCIALTAVLTGVTQHLIDKWDLLPKASGVFQWVIDHGLRPLLGILDRILIKIEAVKSAFEFITERVLGVSEAGPETLDELYPNAGKEKAAGKNRASGGKVHPNNSYLVGEFGREMFVPATAGRIIPNRELARTAASSGGGGNAYSITVNSLDPRSAGKIVVDAIQAYESSNGKARVRQ